MFRVRCSRTVTGVTLTTLLLAVISWRPVGGEPELETAWTEDPPQMTSEKVRLGDVKSKLENKVLIPTVLFQPQDKDISQNVDHEATYDSVHQADREMAQHKQNRVTLKPDPRIVQPTHATGDRQSSDEINRSIKQYASQNRGEVSQTTNMDGNELKFVSSSADQDSTRHKINENGQNQSDDIPQSEVKTEENIVQTAASVHDKVLNESFIKKSSSDTRPTSTGDSETVLTEEQPVAVDFDIADELPDVSFVKMEEFPPTQVVIKNLLDGTVKLFRNSKSKNPFLEMLKHNRAFFEDRLKPNADGEREKIAFFNADPKKKSGFILSEMDPNTVMSSKDNSDVNEGKRERRSVPFVGVFPPEQAGVRDNSTKLNDTRREQGKQPAPTQEEELKISRIGYIIFEKNGKIKEAKETRVSDLRKVNRTSDRLHKPLRKKLVQTCRHGQYTHPIGQPHEPPGQDAILIRNFGNLVESHGGVNKPEAMTNGKNPVPINHQGNSFGQNKLGPNNFGPNSLRPNNLGPNSFGSNNLGQNSFDPNKFGPNIFGTNSLEILAIRDDNGKGKELPDMYETPAHTMKEKRHYSSYVSAFHMVLIIAICVATFVTILYLSSKYKSDQSCPRRMNSHTALFETNPKYEKY